MPASTAKGLKGFGAASLALAAFLSFSACSILPQASKDRLLIQAAGEGKTRQMTRLIKSGANINACNAEGWTPYLAASTNGQFEAMWLLRSLGAKTSAPELVPLSQERRPPMTH